MIKRARRQPSCLFLCYVSAGSHVRRHVAYSVNSRDAVVNDARSRGFREDQNEDLRRPSRHVRRRTIIVTIKSQNVAETFHDDYKHVERTSEIHAVVDLRLYLFTN